VTLGSTHGRQRRERDGKDGADVNEDEVWVAIDTGRTRIADLLETLTPEEWDHPSLCEGWRVRDVAAHIPIGQEGLGSVLLGALRHPGPLNHVIRETARSRGSRPTERLVADLRATVGARRPNFSVTYLENLIDILVHGQDIAVPLGRSLPAPVDAAATAAARVWSYRETRRGRKKSHVFRNPPYDGYRFIATDVSWSAGEGSEIRGPIMAILLVLTGRPAGRSDLTGEGTVRLAQSLDVTLS
jgi:uncharacterized protein (TIGR03083 family)